MRMIVGVVAVVWLVGADAPADAVNKDMALFAGEWSMVSGERDGEAIPEMYLKSGKRVFKDGEVTVTLGDMLLMKAKVTLDPAAKPKTIDYDVSDGVLKGKKQLGIYEIDGDTVKFCFVAPDKERPTDFTTKAGSGRSSSVWKKKAK